MGALARGFQDESLGRDTKPCEAGTREARPTRCSPEPLRKAAGLPASGGLGATSVSRSSRGSGVAGRGAPRPSGTLMLPLLPERASPWEQVPESSLSSAPRASTGRQMGT